MTAAAAKTLLTVGHSTHSFDRFAAVLRSGRAEVVADVRRFPGSRRNPHFGADALPPLLAGAGVDYVPLGETLGGRRRAADAEGATADNSAWRNGSFRAYADYMGTEQFQRGIEELESIAAERRTAIMCAETHPSRCHRRLIADQMLARGWRVFHLLPGREPVRHELTAHGRIDGWVVLYPGPPPEQ